ncbi:hypothetical protein IRY61_02575 [Candidatus Saccharibacteria bacterium]|nr:hypothetical protein [Candidatus Saccharibacteria bacterium]
MTPQEERLMYRAELEADHRAYEARIEALQRTDDLILAIGEIIHRDADVQDDLSRLVWTMAQSPTSTMVYQRDHTPISLCRAIVDKAIDLVADKTPSADDLFNEYRYAIEEERWERMQDR